MHSQDYIIAHARMELPEPAMRQIGPFDVEQQRVVPRRRQNPLRCAPYHVSAGRAAPVTPEDARKGERRAILAKVVANDHELLPRARNGGGDHTYLQQFTGALTFWRRMANPPAELGTWAANDNEPDVPTTYVKGGNPLPMEAEAWLSMLPVPVRVCVRTTRNGQQQAQMVTKFHWHPSDIEYVHIGDGLKRVKRLGGFEFGTVDNATAKDKAQLPTVKKDGSAKGYLVPLGSITAYTRNGHRKFVTQDNSRDRPEESEDALLAAKQTRDFYKMVLAGPHGLPLEPRKPRKLAVPRKVLPEAPVTGSMPEVTYCPPGLPYGHPDLAQLFWGIGSTASGRKTGVHRPVDSGYAIWDAKGDETAVARFRADNDNHAKVLDACLVAANMTDIAAVLGKSSPHTGRAKLLAACAALRDFLDKNAG